MLCLRGREKSKCATVFCLCTCIGTTFVVQSELAKVEGVRGEDEVRVVDGIVDKVKIVVRAPASGNYKCKI